jgi:hypothetical protein
MTQAELYIAALVSREEHCRRLAALETTPSTTANEMELEAATLNSCIRMAREYLLGVSS